MNHTIPLETHVSFKGDSIVYVVTDYNILIGPCDKPCPYDHDCYDTPYITVRREILTAKPISELETIFTPEGVGIEVTEIGNFLIK